MNDVNYLISIRYLSGPEDPLNNPINMNEEGGAKSEDLVEPTGPIDLTIGQIQNR